MACLVLPQAKTFKEFQRGSYAGDEHFNVDRLVQSCQPKVMPALPSAGRELVPYFSSPGECSNETLSQSKSDAARKRKKSFKKSCPPSASPAASPARQSSLSKSVPKRVAHKQPEDSAGSSAVKSKRLQASGTNANHAAAGNEKTPVSQSTKDLKAWAGPSYYTSPPPEHLPMPTSFLLAV